MNSKTKIIDILESHQIPFRLLPHNEPVYTMEAAARQRGVVEEEMVKSILLREKDGRFVMACVLGNARLDPKAVRASLPNGWKRLTFASAEEILEVTGCVMGAVAPLALPPDLPVFFDQAIAGCQKVSISSGDPMAGIEMDAQDLIRLSGAQMAAIQE